jgi:hypothetical protein
MLVLALQNFARVVSLSLLNKPRFRYLRSSSWVNYGWLECFPWSHRIRDNESQLPKEKRTKGQTIIYKHDTGDEFECSGRVNSSCSTSDTRRVNLVTNPVISNERGKDREVLTTSGTYPWSFVTQILQVLHVCFVDRCFCPFLLFLLAIALSVLLRYMDYDCPFGIFKLFF